MLRAATACNFSSLLSPAGSAPAALASLLFDPPEPQIIGQTQCFETFLPFHASASSFFSLFLFYSSFFYLSLLSASSLLCFSCAHIVGSLTSKLPSPTTKELACTVRQPGPCVRALCEAVAVLLSQNMTCGRPRCNATSSKHFPHTSHPTLHTCTSSQLISSELFSSHSMSSHMSAKLFLAIFMSATSQY